MATERAMKAAVEMEIHAALSTTTAAKGEELDKYFPAHDEMLIALRECRDLATLAKSLTANGSDDEYIRAVSALIEITLAKAEGRT